MQAVVKREVGRLGFKGWIDERLEMI